MLVCRGACPSACMLDCRGAFPFDFRLDRCRNWELKWNFGWLLASRRERRPEGRWLYTWLLDWMVDWRSAFRWVVDRLDGLLACNLSVMFSSSLTDTHKFSLHSLLLLLLLLLLFLLFLLLLLFRQRIGLLAPWPPAGRRTIRIRLGSGVIHPEAEPSGSDLPEVTGPGESVT